MATRGTRGPNGSLQQSVDRLAEAFDKLADRLERLEGSGAGAAAASNEDAVARHIKRYMPFYALAAIFALFIFLIPTKNGNDNGTQASNLTPTTQGVDPGTVPGDAGPSGTTSVAGNSVSRNGGSSAPTGSVVGGGTAVKTQSGKTVDWLAWQATGTTAGGYECKPGVRQIPWSAYAVPCFPKWTGGNGGATYKGVTGDKVVIVSRHFPDTAASQAVDAFVAQAGFASGDEVTAADHEFRKFMTKVFESWGRKIEYIDYQAKYGDSTKEALGQGQDQACLDADNIIATYHPFMVVGTGANPGASAVFGECAAKRHLMVLGTGAYYPEWWYQKYHPYLWNGVMNCTMIAYQNAEYLGKRIAQAHQVAGKWVNAPAKWAKGTQKNKPRAVGVFVPTNAEYQSCLSLARDIDKKQYHTEPASQFNYQLDISRFADQAAQAIAKFIADGVTTVFLACDPLSPIFLTQDATNQAYFPEWVTNGAGLTDVEQFARLWDQTQIQGSLFGMSQLGDTGLILGPKGEGTVTYKKATGKDIPPGTQTQYYAELGIFGAIQAAGPVLTPDNVAKSLWHLPPAGAPLYEVGYSNYSINPDGTPGRQHTSVSDMREIYWVCTSVATDPGGTSRCNSPKSYDGKGGLYKATYNGKRYRNGQWPTGEPPIYPNGPKAE